MGGWGPIRPQDQEVRPYGGLGERRAVQQVLRLMGGAGVSGLGAGLFMILGPWLLYDLTRSAFWTGTVSVIQGLLFWATPSLGTIVDRVDRRTVLIWGVLAQGMGAAGLAVLVAIHRADVAAALVAVVLISGGLKLQFLAGAAVRLILTPADARLRLNSWWSATTLLSQYGAPGLAGFLLQWRGEAVALAAEALGALPLLITAFFLPQIANPHAGDSGSLREAAGTLRRERGLWLFTWTMALWNWTFGGIFAILVYFYRSDLHFTPAEVGMSGLLAGVIPMAFASVGASLNRRLGPGRILVGGVVLSGLGMLALPAATGPWMVGGLLGLMDGPISPILAAMSTILQARIPSRLFGRVNAFRMLVSMGATPTAGVLAGVLAGRFGATAVIEGFGACAVLGALLIAWRTPVFRVTLSGQVAETSHGEAALAMPGAQGRGPM
jgi:predicted MFS family arabinose efflux permease